MTGLGLICNFKKLAEKHKWSEVLVSVSHAQKTPVPSPNNNPVSVIRLAAHTREN